MRRLVLDNEWIVEQHPPGLPSVLGHYRLRESVGQGGMGVVYRASDTRLGRTVALKVLQPEKVADPERKRRFIQEAKAASALNHPNIVTIHDIDSDQGIDYLVMEFIEGQTLDARIPRRGMRPAELAAIAIQIADGLAAAHAAGITHRDLKPTNILVNGAGHVKILDFGLAKLTDRGETTEADATQTALPATTEGSILGTVSYMSPEQAEGKPVDTRSDIFSFGSVLYEMASGRRAFRADTPASTLGAVIHKEPEPLAKLQLSIPRELDRIVARCLRKNRERRFQSVADLGVALLELKEECDLGLHDAGADSSVATVSIRRMPQALALAMAGAMLAASAGMWLWMSRQGPAQSPVHEVKITQITRDSGLTTDPALSPDGKLLAYASNRADGKNMDIWVQQTAGGQPARLTRHAAADRSPQFSPDGTTIYFHSVREGEGSIWAISTLGGDERLISREMVLPGILLSPDGRLICAKRFSLTGQDSPAYLVPAAGGAMRKLETSARTFHPRAWSEDSKTLIGWGKEGPSGPTTGNEVLAAIPADGGPPTYVLKDGRPFAASNPSPGGGGRLLWQADQLYVSGDGSIDEYVLTRSRALEGPVKRWARFPGASLDFSKSGGLIVAASTTTKEDVWVLPVDANRGKVTGPPARVTDDEARDWRPTLSRDGRKLAYTSDRSGNRDVWLRDWATGKETQVTASPEVEWRAAISPDGAQVAYEVEGTVQSIFLRDFAGGDAKRVCGKCSLPDWTPDSSRITFWDGTPVRFYSFNPATGERQILVAHAKEAVQTARVSTDSQWVCFRLPAEGGRSGIWIAPLRAGQAAPEAEWIAVAERLDNSVHTWWSPDGNLIYIIQRRADLVVLAQPLDPATKRTRGEPFPVFKPEAGFAFLPLSIAGFSMTPDRLVFSMMQSRSNLWRIE